ncbi:MAG: dickkopf-related protein [Candidatus Nanoarchaeia archaeon]|nr:dickkopf-related protein [Candidatus Nanoarchaeia archaeon]
MRLSLIIIVVFLLLPFVIAEDTSSFDVITSYDWLSNNTVINDNSRENVLALLALNNQGIDITENLNKFINNNDCWPSGNCDVINTAFALLLLEKTGQNTNSTITWLNNKEIAAGSTGGKWIIQIATTANGTCDISSDNVVKKVSVSQSQGWIDINTINAMGTSKSKVYSVDCADLGDPNMHISLLYNIDTPQYKETFLLQDEQTQQKDISVNNACFPKISGNACDLDSTLYATWVLNELGEEVHTIPYLEERLTEISQNPLKLSLLYLITKSPAYATMLKDKQKASGSWVDDVYTTSFASLVMLDGNQDAYLNATNWLSLKRDKKDFSWNHKIIDTAMALIAIHGSIDTKPVYLGMEAGNVELICNDLIDNDGDGLIDCQDPDCAADTSCTCKATDECISDSDCVTKKGVGYSCDLCACVKSGCSKSTGDACESDSDCSENQYCDYNSCSCVDQALVVENEICNDKIDNDNNGFIDCKDPACVDAPECKKSSLWIWILLLLLSLGGGAFYYFSIYKAGKGFGDLFNFKGLFGGKKPKAKGKSFEEYVAQKESKPVQNVQQVQRPQQPFTQRSRKQDDVEDALEKSLQEAKKLLGK